MDMGEEQECEVADIIVVSALAKLSEGLCMQAEAVSELKMTTVIERLHSEPNGITISYKHLAEKYQLPQKRIYEA